MTILPINDAMFLWIFKKFHIIAFFHYFFFFVLTLHSLLNDKNKFSNKDFFLQEIYIFSKQTHIYLYLFLILVQSIKTC